MLIKSGKMISLYPGICEARRKGNPSYLIYHPQRSKMLPTITDYSRVHTFDARTRTWCVRIYIVH